MNELEYCSICGDPTGKAGKSDDSLYMDDDGPYCEECWEELIDYYFDDEPRERKVSDGTYEDC